MALDSRTLERILILRTMLTLDPRGDGISAIEIADRASTECDNDALEALPEISRRGVGAKLLSMRNAALVASVFDHEQRLTFWFATGKGRDLAASLPAEGGDATTDAETVGVLAAAWRHDHDELCARIAELEARPSLSLSQIDELIRLVVWEEAGSAAPSELLQTLRAMRAELRVEGDSDD